MKDAPSERLDHRARLLWRITGAVQTLLIVLLSGGVIGGLFFGAGAPLYLWTIPAALTALAVLTLVVAIPTLRWRRWRYEIRSDEVDLQRGIVWVSRTLVPLARIQHVDTRTGPLERGLGLATVVFYTAAGPNQIPELSAPVAGEVRDRIAELAREQDEL
ncbi:PH domain-containing protein [Rubrobacter aplysinae]|uniref:PH domain-containing protein n=1 Tax=Rubrobacter aplysinae TaxID=909625 RepID=UPI00064BD172|nr:PH domain-containing protein [Rubrobacter aplysinae]